MSCNSCIEAKRSMYFVSDNGFRSHSYQDELMRIPQLVLHIFLRLAMIGRM